MITRATLGLNQEPLISVVLPAYNGEKYLAEAIDSILAQTFGDFELIIIDDGSTDDTPKILSDYAQRDQRIRMVVRENKGLVTTLNDLIDMARGLWIARMDQDDIALPHRFECQLAWLDKTGADISGSWVKRFGSLDERIVRLHKSDEAIKTEMLFSSPFAHPSVIMRAALVKELRYNPAWEKAEDYDLWERAAEAGWTMTNVPEVLMLYRVHADQITTRTMSLVQQRAQEIRRRYWLFRSHAFQFNQVDIDEFLKIYESTSTAIDMDSLDYLFSGLLQRSYGEARAVIFDNMTRLYFRAAANCSNIVSRWGKLNANFGSGWGWGIKFRLWVFRLFRIRVNGILFKQLKKLYVWKASH